MFKTPSKHNHDQYLQKQLTFNDYLNFLKELEITSIIEIVDKPANSQHIEEETNKNNIKYSYVFCKNEKPSISKVKEFISLV